MGSRTRSLIVNADDFGQSDGINRGIITAYEQGIVTSASLMVHWPAAAEAAAYSRAHPSLSLGLHLDLGEWFYRDGNWMPLYERVNRDDAHAISDVTHRQTELFHRLVGRAPSHLDSHQHVHRRDTVRSVMLTLAQTLRVSLRGCDPEVQICGAFYGQTTEGLPAHDAISFDGLRQILVNLPAGVTELTCHPADLSDGLDGLETMYRMERGLELKVLCDPRIRTALGEYGIWLCSFHEIRQGTM